MRYIFLLKLDINCIVHFDTVVRSKYSSILSLSIFDLNPEIKNLRSDKDIFSLISFGTKDGTEAEIK